MSIKQINFSEVALQVNQNLFLRSVRVSEAKKLYELINENRSYLDRFLPWVEFNKTEKDSLRFLEHCCNQFFTHKELHLFIEYDKEICGLIGLEIDLFNNRADIGYWITEEMSGRGIMTKSLSELVKFSFKVLNLHKLIIKCNPENKASKAIAVKNNFTLEGHLKEHEKIKNKYFDLLQYRLLKSEYLEN
ncbi:MAG: N-acetyltransferase [Chitinophagaceae bacterium]|nr:MAG: N-acetyltransferase [Chitinophagaceae bacterium]